MPSCTLLSSGLLTTLQDLGRPGYAYYAISQSGALDQRAAQLAALLLDIQNPVLIECTGIPPSLQFDQETELVLTGADFHWKIDGQAIPMNNRITAPAGSILNGSPNAKQFRSYIGILGQLEADKVLGSYATDTLAKFGGYHGRALKKGDVLHWTSIPRLAANEFYLELGPESKYLRPESLEKLFKNSFTIDPNSDRMGCRLTGPKLTCTPATLQDSVPVIPGMLILPQDGQMIILQRNGQSTGGYPRIGLVHDLSRLNQIPLGQQIRFVPKK